MAFKDWAALVISSLALVASATTLYVNVIRQTDDLSMIVGPPPLPKITDGKIEIPNPIGVTFINSGTRGASINAVGVQIESRSGA